MKFSFHDSRGKDALLAKYTDEEIMAAMGVPITEERFCSPFREDRHPTCDLWRVEGSNNLYFMDWAVLDHQVDIFGLYMYLHGTSFSDAVSGLWDLMEGSNQRKTQVQSNGVKIRKVGNVRLTCQTRPWEDRDLAWWGQFGITRAILSYFNVYPADYIWIKDHLAYVYSAGAHPAYVYRIGKATKVYFPFRKDNRFLHDNARVLQGYEQLPATGNVLVITKSLKDVMLLYRYMLPAIAPMAETIALSEKQLAELTARFKHVVAFYDNDHAGIQALRRFKSIGLDIYMLPRSTAKDATDYYRKYGPKNLEVLIDSVLHKYIYKHF